MDAFTATNLQMLFAKERGPCVSLYMPTVRSESEAAQNPLRLKNLLNEAERQLIAGGVPAVEARMTLARGREWIEDEAFWNGLSDGLALFLTPDFAQCWRLPVRFESCVQTGNQFAVRPLWPLALRDTDYYVLAVSQNAARLYHGTRWTITELDARLPQGVQAALGYDEPQQTAQHHTGQPALGGKQGAVFHGQGGKVDAKKAELLNYFRVINQVVVRTLHGRTQPLVFAGVAHLFPIYQSVNHYPHLAPSLLEGNPDHLSPRRLLERSWKVAEPLLNAEPLELAQQYSNLAAAGRATADLAEVVRAASQGRVATLFVAETGRVWGRLDPVANRVWVEDAWQPGLVDLVEWAARATFENRGTIFVVPGHQMPENGLLAAALRYPVPAAIQPH